MSINLELYNFFYSIAKYKSFSEAAKELYISQPAITQKINNLEKSLNAKLFYRKSNGIKLTEEGNKLYKQIKEPIDLLEKIEEDRKKARDSKTKQIIIGIDERLLNISFLYKIVIRFYKVYPRKKIVVKRINRNEGINLLFDNEMNFYLANNAKEFRRKNINIQTPILLHPCFYTSKKFYDKNKEKIKSFNKNQFIYILPKEGTMEREILNKLIKKDKILLDSIYEADNSEIQDFLVKSDMGISFGFRENITDELEKGELIEIKISKNLEEYSLDVIEKKKDTTSYKKILWI